MLRRLYTLWLLLLPIAACQPAAAPMNETPTTYPFATMTPGRVLSGPLSTVAPDSGGGNLANPATAIALANRPTATPDTSQCPSVGRPDLGGAPANSRAMVDEIARFLTAGGSPAVLERGLRDDWQVLGETGLLRADFDLTGEGTPDLLLSFAAPAEGGTLAVFVCSDGRYAARYQDAIGGEAPQIIQVGDMNFDARPDVLFGSRVCSEDDACAYHTQLVTWRPDLSRFVSLLDRDITSQVVPTVADMDNDQVGEVVIRMTDDGDASTGPLRTGLVIYDWNGAGYVQSITQLDPPRFKIQVIHEADRALQRQDAQDAISLYTLALASPELEAWRNDEGPVLQSYARFKLLLAHAFAADGQALTAYQAILDAFPDGNTAPVYVPLSTIFWNAFQVTNNLRSACAEVRAAMAAQPDAVNLMNRYGSQSPTYDENTICPF